MKTQMGKRQGKGSGTQTKGYKQVRPGDIYY